MEIRIAKFEVAADLLPRDSCLEDDTLTRAVFRYNHSPGAIVSLLVFLHQVLDSAAKLRQAHTGKRGFTRRPEACNGSAGKTVEGGVQ